MRSGKTQFGRESGTTASEREASLNGPSFRYNPSAGAILDGARLCVSVIEASQGAAVPVAQSQKLMKSITAGLNAVVEGRGEIVSAVRQLSAIKARSNLAPEAYGCPEGWDAIAIMPATGSAREPQPAR